MAVPLWTLTWHVPATQMSAGLLRLTALLVQTPYTFLHTFHRAGYSEVDIYDAQYQLLARVALRLGEPQAECTLLEALASQAAPPPDLASLLPALRQLWTPVTSSDVPQ